MGVGGCAPASVDRAAWVTNHGGLVDGPLHARADAALRRLEPAIAGRGDIRVYVLDSATAGAFSWPDGSVFVSRSLVESLDERELSAAIAHELGHLLNDGHLRTVASLRGCCVSPDAEARADATGVEVLRRSGLDPAAMRSMLGKVRELLLDDQACRQAIGRRIDLLSTANRVR